MDEQALRTRLDALNPGQRIGLGAGLEDPWYPPAERGSRTFLKIFLEMNFSVWALTRNDGILRDLDLLSRMEPKPVVVFSFISADDPGAMALEGRCSPVSKRMAALTACRQAGLPVGIFLSPVDLRRSDIEDHALLLLDEARSRGASFALIDFLKNGPHGTPGGEGAQTHSADQARFERAFQQEAIDRDLDIRCPWPTAKEGLGPRDLAILALHDAWAYLKFLGKTRTALAEAALAINWMVEEDYLERVRRGMLREIRGVGPWIQNLLSCLHEGHEKPILELAAEVRGQKKSPSK